MKKNPLMKVALSGAAVVSIALSVTACTVEGLTSTTNAAADEETGVDNSEVSAAPAAAPSAAAGSASGASAQERQKSYIPEPGVFNARTVTGPHFSPCEEIPLEEFERLGYREFEPAGLEGPVSGTCFFRNSRDGKQAESRALIVRGMPMSISTVLSENWTPYGSIPDVPLFRAPESDLFTRCDLALETTRGSMMMSKIDHEGVLSVDEQCSEAESVIRGLLGREDRAPQAPQSS